MNSATQVSTYQSPYAEAAPKQFAYFAQPTFMGRPEIINAKLHKTKHYMLDGFSDPSETEGTEEEKLAAFRQVRDEIKQWIVEEFANLNLDTIAGTENSV